MADASQTLRNVRIIHFAFLAVPAVLFFAISTVQIESKPENTFLPTVLVVLAVSEVGIATGFRAKLLRPAAERLQQSPQDSAALEQWQRGSLLSFAFATTVVLFGVVIRVMGFSWNIAAWFFVAGFFLLLWWTPRLELAASRNAAAPPPPTE
jgi:hypothetical protein